MSRWRAGNLVLADHGITYRDDRPAAAPVGEPDFRLALGMGPLTMQCRARDRQLRPGHCGFRPPARNLPAAPATRSPRWRFRHFLNGSELWTPVPDLLDSPPSRSSSSPRWMTRARACCASATANTAGRSTAPRAFERIYRIGNGAAGNVGAEAIAHVALPRRGCPSSQVRNPLAASGGTETRRPSKRSAGARRRRFGRSSSGPSPRRTTSPQRRNCRRLPARSPRFRWTGSWYTVFVAIDPRDPADLVRLPDGPGRAGAASREAGARVSHALPPGRLRPGDPPAAFRAARDSNSRSAPRRTTSARDVTRAVLEALGNRRAARTAAAGFFHPGQLHLRAAAST